MWKQTPYSKMPVLYTNLPTACTPVLKMYTQRTCLLVEHKYCENLPSSGRKQCYRNCPSLHVKSCLPPLWKTQSTTTKRRGTPVPWMLCDAYNTRPSLKISLCLLLCYKNRWIVWGLHVDSPARATISRCRVNPPTLCRSSFIPFPPRST